MLCFKYYFINSFSLSFLFITEYFPNHDFLTEEDAALLSFLYLHSLYFISSNNRQLSFANKYEAIESFPSFLGQELSV